MSKYMKTRICVCIKYLEGGHIKREVNKHLEKFVVEEKAVFIGEICP